MDSCGLLCGVCVSLKCAVGCMLRVAGRRCVRLFIVVQCRDAAFVAMNDLCVRFVCGANTCKCLAAVVVICGCSALRTIACLRVSLDSCFLVLELDFV